MKLAFWALLLSLFGATAASAQDLQRAVIVAATSSGPQAAAVELLADEVRSRTGLNWPILRDAPSARPLIVVGRLNQIMRILPPEARLAWRRAAVRPVGAEGFTVNTLSDRGRPIIVLAGNDARGVLYAVGYLLRKLQTGVGAAQLSAPLDVAATPAQSVRGTQIGYRFKNNSYDAWTVAMLAQRVRDLAIFGANTIQVIAPESDDAATSPLFPAPPLTTLIGLGKATHRYGLDFDLYYPQMADDYARPGAVQAELKRFEALVRALPRIDALYIPGGDPGHTAPDILFPLAAKEAAILRRYNPNARIWISGQGFDRARYEAFYKQLTAEPQWLTGVVFGPQSRDPLSIQRRRIPARYPIQMYPDIGHTLHAQFPAPQWDPAFALTEGREPIDPRPRAETTIFRAFAPLTTGFITYSEGVNDDVNQALWLQLGWSPTIDPHVVMLDYARTFLGAKIGERSSTEFANGLFALEQNWVGPVRDNDSVETTLRLFDALNAAASPAQRTNWRFESPLYRADYDAYVRARATAESARERAAMAALVRAPEIGSHSAMTVASQALSVADADRTRTLRAHLFNLAGRLYSHARLQLSVKLYGASGVERGANLDRVDTSLNDRVWLTRRFAEIAALPGEPQRLAAIADLADWSDARDGALYDDLGDPSHEPHLLRGSSFDRDPELYDTAIDGVADMTPDDGWRVSWITYGETLYDRPLTLAYRGLDPHRAYRLKVTYAGEDYHLPMRLVANGSLEIQSLTDRPTNPAISTLLLPPAATADGSLTLQWIGAPGAGGGGRGRQVAEVWLIHDHKLNGASHAP